MDNSYVLGRRGFLYTSTQLPKVATTRHPAVVLISVNQQSFRLQLPDGRTLHATAALVPPRVERVLDAQGVPTISLNILPTHASFHVFRAMQQAGVMPLDRHAFNTLNDEFKALLHGQATVEDAARTFRRAVREALRQLPPAPPPDAKALALIKLLDAHPELGIDELAQRMGHTRQVMARLFSQAVGMSLRDYQNWLKQRRVFETLHSQQSLTEVAQHAGFADSPQFTRTYQRWYGQTPSASRDPKRVRLFFPGPQAPHLAAQDQDAGSDAATGG